MFILGGASRAATINVPADYATIQDAVTASSDGDTVIVAPGTYSGAGNVDIDFGGRNINVESSGGAASTIIDCQGSSASPHKGFYIHTGETAAVIQGFTIQNGYDAANAGGVTVIAATAAIRQCVIQSCKGKNGGGVCVACKAASPFTAGAATITSCVFQSNTAIAGGGLYIGASSVSVLQCDFLSNVATVTTGSGVYGGGIEVVKNNSNTVTDSITDCVFLSNSSKADGGAVDMASNNLNQTVKVFNCSFYGNSSGAAGTGTIDFFSGTNTVRNCIFYGDASSKEISTSSPPAAAVVQYCDVHQVGYAGVNNNINADPLYVDDTNGNLHLQPTSPCIAAGTSTGAPATDHDATAWTSNVSMGAFDAVAALPATHYSVSAPAASTAGAAFTVTVTALDSTEATVTGYTGRVRLTSSDAAAVLPPSATLTAGVGTFTVTLITAGSQTVTATDTASSITGTSGAVAVSAAPADHFVVIAPSVSSAGAALSVSVTAEDTYGNTDTNYTGTVHFTSTDTAAMLPADATLTSGAGVFSVTLITAGSQKIAATDTVTSALAGMTGAIAVSPGATSQFAVSAPSAAVMGTPFSLTVVAKDAYGNTTPGYAGTAHITSTDGAAVLPADATLTGGSGGFTVTLFTVGSQTLTATDTVTSAITGTTGAVAVSPAPVTHFIVSAHGTTTAGIGFGFYVIAQDAYGNTVTSYTGTIHFRSTDRQAVLPPDSTLTNGVGYFGATLKTAGSQKILVADTGANASTGISATITINASTLLRLYVTPYGAAKAGIGFSYHVFAVDAYGNTVPSYMGTVHFSSSDPRAVLPADAALPYGAGVFASVLNTVGNQTIHAVDNARRDVYGTSRAITVSSGIAMRFVVTAYGSVKPGAPFRFNVIAIDAYGNTAVSFNGSVHFTSTDANAVLPPDSALTNGVGSFVAALKTSGSQSITATETDNIRVKGTSAGVTVTAAPPP